MQLARHQRGRSLLQGRSATVDDYSFCMQRIKHRLWTATCRPVQTCTNKIFSDNWFLICYMSYKRITDGSRLVCLIWLELWRLWWTDRKMESARPKLRCKLVVYQDVIKYARRPCVPVAIWIWMPRNRATAASYDVLLRLRSDCGSTGALRALGLQSTRSRNCTLYRVAVARYRGFTLTGDCVPM